MMWQEVETARFIPFEKTFCWAAKMVGAESNIKSIRDCKLRWWGEAEDEANKHAW